jgi:hypothetical protein
MNTKRFTRRLAASCVAAVLAISANPHAAFSDLTGSAGVTISGTGTGYFSAHTYSSVNPTAYMDMEIYLEHSENGSVSASPGVYGSEYYGSYSVSCARDYWDNGERFIHPTGYTVGSISLWASGEQGSAYAYDDDYRTCQF